MNTDRGLAAVRINFHVRFQLLFISKTPLNGLHLQNWLLRWLIICSDLQLFAVIRFILVGSSVLWRI